MKRLTQAEQAFHKIGVGGMYFTGNPEITLALVRFFGEQVSPRRFPVRNLSRCSNLESLFGPGVGLNLRHDRIFTVYPAGAPTLAGNLWNRLG